MEQTIIVEKWCGQYLAERERKWSVITRNSYYYLSKHHIIPAIGKIKMADLTNDTIQSFYTTLAINGLGTHSTLCVHLMLRQFWDEA